MDSPRKTRVAWIMKKIIEMHIYFVESTDEWRIEITKNNKTDNYAFENFERLVDFLNDLERVDLT